MNHEDALQQMSVERYLLGELTGQAREIFEEHLFDCPLCALDLRSGVTLLEGVRAELEPAPVPATVPHRKSRSVAWLLNPVWMLPSLAACLALIVYQSLVVIPALHQEVASVGQPAILNTAVLAGGGLRGGKTLSIVAPPHGSFLLSVDLPTSLAYAGYRCLLLAPSGTQVWQGSVTPEQARDTVLIHIPVNVTQAGENTFVIQGVRQGVAPGAKLDNLTTHKFILELQK